MWEHDVDVALLPPPLDDGKSLPMAKSRRQLLALRGDVENPFSEHVTPRNFVGILRARTHAPVSPPPMPLWQRLRLSALAEATRPRRIVHPRTRPRGWMLAYVLRTLHFHTPHSMMSMRGVPPTRDRCHVFNTVWVVSNGVEISMDIG